MAEFPFTPYPPAIRLFGTLIFVGGKAMEINMDKQDIIMVIPGSNAQIPLINSLHKNGYSVVCVNPYKDSPAFPYSDYSECFDILDVQACAQVAEKYSVLAVMSDECDIAMPTVAAVSEKLGLNSIGADMAELYTNKYAMREFSIKNGFSAPKYKLCGTLEEAKKFLSYLGKKMIIKPLDSNSSRGVYTISEGKDLERLFEKSLSYSKIMKAVICEEYIEGTEFTVDGLVYQGKHYSLAVSEKKHYAHHPNIACELYFSHYNQNYDYDALRKQNDLYVEKSGLPFGFTHAEYKYDGEKFVLIEIGARGGGNYISSHIIPIMQDIDNYRILIESTLGICQSEDYKLSEESARRDRCCVLKFFDIDKKFDGKILKEVKGESFLRENPNVLLYSINVHIGECVNLADDDSKRIGFYIAYSETKEELDSFIELVDKKVCFEF